jgi:hypothetical protein
VVSGANQPLPLVRFQLLLQKAAEICQEVKSLGSNLLAVIEMQDSEALSILRARHERTILGLAESVKYSQWQEAIKAREGGSLGPLGKLAGLKMERGGNRCIMAEFHHIIRTRERNHPSKAWQAFGRLRLRFIQSVKC